MPLRTEVKVGLTVAVAILALIAIYWFLGYQIVGARTYRIYGVFRDAQKLDKGSDIRMAGVKIGQVAEIGLTDQNRAQVQMAIFNGFDIPENSIARITTGGLIGDYYVEILPGSADKNLKPGQRIATAQAVQLDQLFSQTSDLLEQLQAATSGINSILGDKQMVKDIKDTVKTLSAAAASASQLLESARVTLNNTTPQIQHVFANLNVAAENAADISRQLNEAISTEARPNLNAILAQAREATTNLNETLLRAQKLLSTFDQTAANINSSLESVGSIAQEAQQTVANLNQASAGMKDLATDKKLQEDIKKTASNAAEATEQAKELATSLNRKYGGGAKGPTPAQRSAIPAYGISSNALWNTDTGDYRFDADYTFAGDENEFYRVGAYNIGEKTGLNLQAGRAFGASNAVRYGLYASRIGVGYDHMFSRDSRFSLDLFRPNEPELEVRGILGIGSGFGLYGGIADVLHNDQRDLLLGIQYRK